MKFVCMKCETYMSYQDVEQPAEGSLGILFGCDSCGAKIAMVTNPGETKLVSSLGVQFGGRTAPVEPLEMIRGTLDAQPRSAASGENDSSVTWSPAAQQRLEKIPQFVRSFAQREVERMARERGQSTVTGELLDEARDAFMAR